MYPINLAQVFSIPYNDAKRLQSYPSSLISTDNLLSTLETLNYIRYKFQFRAKRLRIQNNEKKKMKTTFWHTLILKPF